MRTSLPSRGPSSSSLGTSLSLTPSPVQPSHPKIPPPKASVPLPPHVPYYPGGCLPGPKAFSPPAMPASALKEEPTAKKARPADAPATMPESRTSDMQPVVAKTAIKSPPHRPVKPDPSQVSTLKRAMHLPTEDETTPVKAKPCPTVWSPVPGHNVVVTPPPTSGGKHSPMPPPAKRTSPAPVLSHAPAPSQVPKAVALPPPPPQLARVPLDTPEPGHSPYFSVPSSPPDGITTRSIPVPTCKRDYVARTHVTQEAMEALLELRTRKGLSNPVLPTSPTSESALDDIYEDLCRQTHFAKQDIQDPIADKIFMRGTTDCFSDIWDNINKTDDSHTTHPVATPARSNTNMPKLAPVSSSATTPPTPSTKAPSPVSGGVTYIELDDDDDDANERIIAARKAEPAVIPPTPKAPADRPPSRPAAMCKPLGTPAVPPVQPLNNQPGSSRDRPNQPGSSTDQNKRVSFAEPVARISPASNTDRPGVIKKTGPKSQETPTIHVAEGDVTCRAPCVDAKSIAYILHV